MMMTIMATKQQQARRYAELYGYHHGGYGSPYGSPWGHRDDFWDEFESGRRGGSLFLAREQEEGRARADAFFRLQILQMLLSRNGREYEEEEEEGEEEDEEDELLNEQAAFYEQERLELEARGEEERRTYGRG